MVTNWIFVIIGLVYIIPVIALLRYYSIIKSREYLLTSIVYIFLMANGIVIGLWGFSNIWETITVLAAILLIIVITKRVLGKSYEKLYYFIFLTSLILAVVNIYLVNTTSNLLEIYRIILFEIIRFLLGFYLFYAYSKVDLVLETRRTKIVANIWRLAGFIALITALIRIGDIIHYLNATSSSNVDPYAQSLNFSLTLISIGALLLSALTGVTAVVFPELFLLSKLQIKSLYSLYEIAESLNKEDEFQILPPSSLLEYINSLRGENSDDELLDSANS